MRNVFKGLLAGAVATVALSVPMLLQAAAGIMPELDLPRMLAGIVGRPGMPAIGWGLHFIVGILVYGAAIAFVSGRPGETGNLKRGVMVATLGWLAMMLALMPMAGHGLFGLHLGIAAPLLTLLLHVAFGLVLGWIYGRQSDPVTPTTRSHA